MYASPELQAAHSNSNASANNNDNTGINNNANENNDNDNDNNNNNNNNNNSGNAESNAARLDGNKVDAFGLGCILFELLCCRTLVDLTTEQTLAEFITVKGVAAALDLSTVIARTEEIHHQEK